MREGEISKKPSIEGELLKLEEDIAKIANEMTEIRVQVEYLEEKLNLINTYVTNHQVLLEKLDRDSLEFRQKFKRMM